MKEVRIIIAGGRDFVDYEYLDRSVLKVIHQLECNNLKTGLNSSNMEEERNQIKIVSGKARGADTLGERFGNKCGFEIKEFPANWDKYGKSAGFIRNEEMAKFASSDDSYGVLIAFWDGKSKGTMNMIDHAKQYGLEVHIFHYDDPKNKFYKRSGIERKYNDISDILDRKE